MVPSGVPPNWYTRPARLAFAPAKKPVNELEPPPDPHPPEQLHELLPPKVEPDTDPERLVI